MSEKTAGESSGPWLDEAYWEELWRRNPDIIPIRGLERAKNGVEDNALFSGDVTLDMEDGHLVIEVWADRTDSADGAILSLDFSKWLAGAASRLSTDDEREAFTRILEECLAGLKR